MKFLDQAKIYLKSGDGGNGVVAFRREKYIEFGGPDGGNGGRGGHIYLRAVDNLNTLIDFRYSQHFKAKKGNNGSGSNRTGAHAPDIYIDVPVGTQIFEEDRQSLIVDMDEVGKTYLICRGGDGGFGNTHYKSSTNRAPRRADKGYPGEECWLWLRLKLIADAGLVGLPNAGKSTFLSVVSRAKPKIADYPFTTLHPQLGVVETLRHQFVIADIPGLIEGASEGIGLGDRFLGHVERCPVLIHLIDVTSDDIVKDWTMIRHELASYDETLASKPEVIALNKCDSLDEETLNGKKAALEEATGQKVFMISLIAKQGVEALLSTVQEKILQAREALARQKKDSQKEQEKDALIWEEDVIMNHNADDNEKK